MFVTNKLYRAFFIYGILANTISTTPTYITAHILAQLSSKSRDAPRLRPSPCSQRSMQISDRNNMQYLPNVTFTRNRKHIEKYLLNPFSDINASSQGRPDTFSLYFEIGC